MFLKETHISTYSQVLMLHQDARLLESLGPRMQVIFKKHLKNRLKNTMLTFEASTKCKYIHIIFVETFNNELIKQLFKPMDAQELQDPKKVSAV